MHVEPLDVQKLQFSEASGQTQRILRRRHSTQLWVPLRILFAGREGGVSPAVVDAVDMTPLSDGIQSLGEVQLEAFPIKANFKYREQH